jgi:hypothetical protein
MYNIWNNVSEILPEFDVPVLLTDGETVLVGYRVDASYRKGEQEKWYWAPCGISGPEWEWDFDDSYGDDQVTHWMTIPKLPN